MLVWKVLISEIPKKIWGMPRGLQNHTLETTALVFLYFTIGFSKMIAFLLLDCSPSLIAQNSNYWASLWMIYHLHQSIFPLSSQNPSTVTKPHSISRSDLVLAFPPSPHFNIAHTICLWEISHPFLTSHKNYKQLKRSHSSITASLIAPLYIICSSSTFSIYCLSHSLSTSWIHGSSYLH